jgi:hypothetical protein
VYSHRSHYDTRGSVLNAVKNRLRMSTNYVKEDELIFVKWSLMECFWPSSVKSSLKWVERCVIM